MKTLPKGKGIEKGLFFSGFLALVTDIDGPGMAVTLDPFIHIKEPDGCSELPELAIAIISRVEFRGLLGDITAHSSQMSPSTFSFVLPWKVSFFPFLFKSIARALFDPFLTHSAVLKKRHPHGIPRNTLFSLRKQNSKPD
jgi:hypothetical protein